MGFDFAKASGDWDALAVAEEGDVFAGSHGAQFTDALEVDDGRAADAQEGLRRQLFLQGSHGFAEDMPGGSGVEHGVISGGFDPVDVFDGDKRDPFPGADGKSADPGTGFRSFGEEFQQGGRECSGGAGGEAGTHATEGLGEARACGRLEKIIQRLFLEGPHRVVIVSGDENDVGQVRGIERPQHLESIHARHLDVQQKEIRAKVLHSINGRWTVCAFRHDLGVGIGAEEAAQAVPGKRFVIDKDNAQFHGIQDFLSSFRQAFFIQSGSGGA